MTPPEPSPPNPDTIGRLIGIARRAERYVPMEELSEGTVTTDLGLDGDHKGPKFPKRRITVLATEDWQEALSDLAARVQQDITLPWTTRRANLLVEGTRLPRARGAILRIGGVELVIEAQLLPCSRMDKAQDGLRKALHPHWRGGVACSVARGGLVKLGDEVEVLHSPPERQRRLP